jgi:hypothetical protein
MGRRLLTLALGAVLATACGSGGDEAAPTTTSTAAVVTTTSTTAPAATSTTRGGGATTTTARPSAARAVIEPAAVAGIPLGANKSQAIAVLGQPTATGQETDLSGKKYDFLRWDISGNRGLTLNFRTESVTSPLLTDWSVSAPGPVTEGGVQVGDGVAKVTAAHGALQAFCCETRVASVTEGPGRMIVVVDNATQRVTRIAGGDPAYWSRSIAD